MKNQMEPIYWFLGKMYIQVKKENENLLFKKDKKFKRKIIIHCVSKDEYSSFEQYLFEKFGSIDIDVNQEDTKQKIMENFRWIGNKIYLQVNVKSRD